MAPQEAQCGENERVGFTVTSMTRQFFNTGLEQAAIMGGAYMGREGTAGSVVLNPAALAFLKKADAQAYYMTGSYSGTGGGVNRFTDEEITAQYSDGGVYASFPIGSGSVLGIGGNTFSTTFSFSPVSDPVQNGSRINAACAIKLNDNLSIGYGVMALHDHHGWGANNFNRETMQLANLKWKLESDSWRHRLGMQGIGGNGMRWGVQATFGYGNSTNLWNGVNTGGENYLSDFGLRAGFEKSLSRNSKLAFDLEWQRIDLEFGRHAPPLSSRQCCFNGNMYRAMLGFEQKLGKNIDLQIGYRQNKVNTLVDFCGRPVDCNYSTAALGIKGHLGENCYILANTEYSWIARGDSLTTATINFSF
jgi:hypothetical protein